MVNEASAAFVKGKKVPRHDLLVEFNILCCL